MAEALHEAVRLLTEELAQLLEDQVVALNMRDKALLRELEEQIQEKEDYRRHLQDKIRDDQLEELAAPPPGNDISLAYVSTWNRVFLEDEVAQIGLYGTAWNKRMRITSCLLAIPTPGAFFQVLEGNAEVVERLFTKIRQDPRHANVTVLLQEKLSARRFGSWPLRARMLNDVDSSLHIPLGNLFATALVAHTIASAFAPPSVVNALVQAQDPLDLTAQQGPMAAYDIPGQEHSVIGFVGLSNMTAAPYQALTEVGHDAPPSATMDRVLLVTHSAHQHVEAAGGMCYPWIGNGMLFSLPAASATAAVQCALRIIKDVTAIIGPGPCCIGMDAGIVFRTVCASGMERLLPGVMGEAVDGAAQVMQEASRIPDCSLLLSAACYKLVDKVAYDYTAVVRNASGGGGCLYSAE
mmetsp:Transcript_36461/g.65204  ORF Transcript_36461/g.65204 Transcript_36461/m.65204 type:complete len:409 (-) Transcript_36461:1583-2809(-)